ncbi:uncharacterized protein BDZ99DRAFT_493398 [Mytilinidion resinicola]|uniref:A to I editase domain-containing protein n=1 Tax=Mytilinidion resinicola TaxID=574789 RepID=A0A6A6Z922_9PEZI|nr:uncharacterized protein BDZ99DRAFT_493398 [Mytilinidion resinicola]KAF2817621.1 hypothetical protein BDZ99DRAFT_493398 [Mytilinidion resinicola]
MALSMSADAIAACVLAAFEALPAKRKPRPRGDGTREWVPLSGIVLSDAIRAFNRFLIEECADLAASGLRPSAFLRHREEGEITRAEHQPFTIKESVQIHMYSSEAPCGDASMELVMDAQDDATPWPVPPPSSEDLDQPPAGLRGRANFSLLGHVRLKPSRTDAPPTLSKSCTDKLALAETASLLSSVTSLLVSPRNAYLSTLVLPAAQYVPTAIARAFGPSGRMAGITPEMITRWGTGGSGYRFQPFEVRPVVQEFAYSRRSFEISQTPVPSNISAVYTPKFQETLIGGVLQGRKQFDPRGASRLCRKSMWKAVADVAALLAVPALLGVGREVRYQDVKKLDLLEWRRTVKADVKGESGPLKGWPENKGDDVFGLE